MKYVQAAVLAVCLIAFLVGPASAQPVLPEEASGLSPYIPDSPGIYAYESGIIDITGSPKWEPYVDLIAGRADRQRRVTCDLLSFSIGSWSFNDSACAAHCLVLGKKGGKCISGVCHCRR